MPEPAGAQPCSGHPGVPLLSAAHPPCQAVAPSIHPMAPCWLPAGMAHCKGRLLHASSRGFPSAALQLAAPGAAAESGESQEVVVTRAWGNPRIWMVGNGQPQPAPQSVPAKTPLEGVGLSPEQTAGHQSKKPGCAAGQMMQLPNVCVLPHRRSPHPPGKNMSPPQWHSGQPFPARSPLPGWTHCQAQSPNPTVAVAERGGEGAASTICRGKPLLGVVGEDACVRACTGIVTFLAVTGESRRDRAVTGKRKCCASW